MRKILLKEDYQMDLEQLLDKLDQSREQILMAIESLPDEALLEPGAIGNWSVADLLVVLTAWESELVTAMMRLEKGQKPDKLLTALKDRDAHNANLIQQGGERDLDAVFDDFQMVRMQLEDWVEAFPMKKLTNPKQYKGLNGRSLLHLIEQCAYGYEITFLPALKAFATNWQELDDEGIQMIPLSTISLEKKDDQSD
jgi:hypothetical protein